MNDVWQPLLYSQSSMDNSVWLTVNWCPSGELRATDGCTLSGYVINNVGWQVALKQQWWPNYLRICVGKSGGWSYSVCDAKQWSLFSFHWTLQTPFLEERGLGTYAACGRVTIHATLILVPSASLLMIHICKMPCAGTLKRIWGYWRELSISYMLIHPQKC